MKKISVFLLFFILLLKSNIVVAQEYYPHRIYAQVKEDILVSQKDTVIEIQSQTLDSLINILQIKYIKRPFYFAKSSFLQQVYEFYFEVETDSVYSVFSKHGNIFGDVEYIYKPQELYDPADEMWQHTVQDSITDDYLWSLVKIDAARAWDISKGDSTLKVAVIDNGFDYNHPDLCTKINPPYDLYTHEQIPITTSDHGTMVASIVAAETVDQGEVPLGDMAAIGYNTRVMVGQWNLPTCLYASTELNAKLISISWSTGCYPTEIMLQVEKEILNNGTIIVRSAGNDPAHCNGARQYPFSGYEDPRVIVVSSTDFNDYHYNSNGGTHSHFPEVDICAPGYSVMVATRSTNSYGNPISWPYYGFGSGTSFATPLVSGVCALVLSLNPCFAPEDVQDIIKNSADPIVDADNYPGIVGAGRVNAYKALLLAQSYLIPDTITAATTWNEKKRIYADLIIDSLATLTITDTLHIAGGRSIIVRPGGKLIVNGGTLTNACDGEMWQGIIVEGNAGLRQTNLTQGSVILNNATVENARNAISTRGSDTNAVYEHTGGIIQATNTLFRNNRRSVEFLSYENHTAGGNVTDNVSYFTRCTFTVDSGNLFAANNVTFGTHVSMWHVRGVKFNGCTFRSETGSHNGRAIYTIEAGFTAKRVCPMPSLDPCDCNNYGNDTVRRCTFNGFSEAVHAANTLGSYAVTLDNCDFADNYTGVSLNAAGNARMSFCDLDLVCTIPTILGGSLNNTSPFTMEGNNFHRNSYSTITAIGICCDSAGTSENKIYLNDFSNLNYGCMVRRNNGGLGTTGLQFQCNSFSYCNRDIYVWAGAKIRKYQGSANVGADNNFIGTYGRSITIGSAADSIRYHRSRTGNHNPIGYTNCHVHDAGANSCASTLCGIPLYPRGTAALPQYRAMAEEYAALLADARGASLQMDETSGNPDNDPQNEDATLIDRLSDLSAQMGDLARAEIRNILNDSVPDMALLKEWYQAITAAAPAAGDIPVSAYQLAEVYSEEGNLSAAHALLSALPQQFSPDEAARSEYANYMSLQQLRETVAGNWYLMTDSDIAAMQQVAEYDNGRAARMAKEILCFFHHICYEDDPLWELDGIGERNLQGGRTDGGRTRGRDGACPVSTMADGLVIYPNPTGGTLTVESASPIREITVYDLSGRVMMTADGGANDYSPLRIMDVSSLPNGIYLLRVATDSGVQTARFVKIER